MYVNDLPYFDVHLHLNRLAAEAHRRWFSGKHGCLSAAVSPSEWPHLAGLVAATPGARLALGVHPFEAQTSQCTPEGLRDALVTHKAIAVGEVGLDFRTPYKPFKRAQLQLLTMQLEVAASLSLPVVVHCVRASGTLYKALKPFARENLGIMHAYSGSADMVPRFAALGLFFSFGGGIARSRKSQDALKRVPLARLLLETDAPYMPLAGDHSAPSNIQDVCQIVADTLHETHSDIARRTWENAHGLLL